MTRDAIPIHVATDAPPADIPPGHVGPIALPGTGRLVYWTGRVAIGLRYQAPPHYDQPVPHSELWVQDLFVDGRRRKAAA